MSSFSTTAVAVPAIDQVCTTADMGTPTPRSMDFPSPDLPSQSLRIRNVECIEWTTLEVPPPDLLIPGRTTDPTKHRYPSSCCAWGTRPSGQFLLDDNTMYEFAGKCLSSRHNMMELASLPTPGAPRLMINTFGCRAAVSAVMPALSGWPQEAPLICTLRPAPAIRLF